MLTVILSCSKHKHLWEEISERLGNILILCGGSDKITLVGNVLYLDCIDTYDGLSEKMMKAYSFIFSNQIFESVTHVLKADDHDTFFTQLDIQNIESKYKDILLHNDYIGQRIVHSEYLLGRCHHFGKVPKESKWYNKCIENKFVPYLGGGEVYILSKRALYYLVNNKEQYKDFCSYEDLMVGSVLNEYDIKPYEINLNIKTWFG